jgi:hypothetical protein
METNMQCWIADSLSGAAEDPSLMGCDAVLLGQ